MNIDGPKIGESPMEEGFRLRPFTAVAVLVFAGVVVASLLLVIFYPDTREKRLLTTLFSLGIDVAVGVTAFAVIQKEERKPFSIAARRTIWWTMLGVSGLVAIFTFRVIGMGAPRLQSIWFLAKLVTLLPMPVIAWHLLKNEKRG